MHRYKPHTRSVLERLRETKWEERGRIAKLVALEGYARNRGSIHPGGERKRGEVGSGAPPAVD